MDRHDVDWKGYIPAITTPFDASGAYDQEAQAALLEWLHGERLHGLVVAGTTGEWFSMTRAEREAQIRLTGAQLKGKMTLLCGCNAYTAQDSLSYAEVAAEAGFDGILVCPPPYVVPTEDETFAFYKEISDNSPLPICIYNWTRGTNVDLSLPLIERLADLEKVVALKNSTPSLRNFLKTFFAMRDRLRIFGFGMDPIGTSMVKNEGGDGLMGAGAVLGSDQPDFFNAIWAGDMEKARELGDKDMILMREWFAADYGGKFGAAQAIFKTALNLQGLPGGHVRAPLLPLNEEQTDIVRDTLTRLGRKLV
ncbi:dihydrodipicolinate synthase family protein [Thalassovita mangrovi]|uniref:Dihydrodipicolinate synthase family protein n=1 Tax=Thalassovita mangrovi TaxID=2692236 RepID=A0A6L8LWD5_9RHOB|nr:dihydrodipicolinate synthase family protein [Thalassovita mangrovi]MYM57582.1 dihydrodipicolinate synthase family protein [Thalassovita mangrovi]